MAGSRGEDGRVPGRSDEPSEFAPEPPDDFGDGAAGDSTAARPDTARSHPQGPL